MKKRTLLNVVALFLPLAAIAGAQTVAVVNGTAITQRQLEMAIDRLIPRASYHGAVTEEKRSEFRDEALEGLVTSELQYQDAVAKGLKPDKKAVSAELDKIRERFNGKKEYKAALEREGMSEAALRAQIEKDVLIRQVIDKMVTVPAKMSDDALKEYYGQNAARFKKPEAFRLRIISMQDEKKAKEAMAKIAAGEDFGNIAARMSEDNFRIKGGDIGFVHQGRIYPELEAVAFKMTPGSVAGPILAENKWYLLKLEERQPAQQLSFSDVKESLRRDLEQKRSTEFMDAWMGQLRAKAKIEIPAPAARP